MKHFLLVILLPVAASAATANLPGGCALLTSAEIGAATGMKVGESRANNMTTKTGQVSGCMWRLGDHGMVNLSVKRSGSKEERDRGLANLRQIYDGMRARGWTITTTKIGETLCDTGIPPKAQAANTPTSVGCFALAKGFVYSVGVMGPDYKIAPEKVKVLADDIAKRLP